jgi:hypothetical protein
MVRPQERPQKRKKVEAPLPEELSDDDDSSIDPEPEPPRPRKKKKINGWDARDPAVLGSGVDYTDAELEGMLAFCCHKCNCSSSKQRRIPANDRYCGADDTTLWHRRCCHDVFHTPDVGDGDEWLPPYDRAYEQARRELEDAGPHPKPAIKNIVTERGVWEKYKNSKSLESELYNDDGKERENLGLQCAFHKNCSSHHSFFSSFLQDPGNLLNINEAYRINEKWFHELAKEAIANGRQGLYRKPATVMVRNS